MSLGSIPVASISLAFDVFRLDFSGIGFVSMLFGCIPVCSISIGFDVFGFDSIGIVCYGFDGLEFDSMGLELIIFYVIGFDSMGSRFDSRRIPKGNPLRESLGTTFGA